MTTTEHPAPRLAMTRCRETLEVTVDLDVTGLGPLRMTRAQSEPLTLSSVTVVATENDGRRSALLHARGTNTHGVAQSGQWALPHATRPPSYDSYCPYVGHITDLPRELLDAVEAATGIRFADYGVEGD